MHTDSLRALRFDVRGNSVALWEIRELRGERLVARFVQKMPLCEVKDDHFQF